MKFLDGCDFAEACTKLAREPPPKAKPNGPDKGDPKPDWQQPQGTFIYCDRDGNPVYRKTRYPLVHADGSPAYAAKGKRGKTFIIEHPDGNGKWVSGQGNAKSIPYRLPELIATLEADRTSTVFVVESEANVERLRSWGLTATSIPTGTENFGEYFAGAETIVLRDNDNDGIKRADFVASKIQPHASAVYVLPPELFDLGYAEGIEDWIARGGNRDKLDAVCAGYSEEWTAPEQQTDADDQANGQTEPHEQSQEQPSAPLVLKFFSAIEFDGLAVLPRRWLVRNRIPMLKPTLFSGHGGTGKTRIAGQLCVATVRNLDWFNAVIDESGAAMFLSVEEDRDDLHRLFADIAAARDVGFDKLANLHLNCISGSDGVLAVGGRKSGVLTATETFLQLKAFAKDLRPRLITIENSAQTFAGNELARSEVQQFASMLHELAIIGDSAVLLISHPSLAGLSSGSGISGSTQWNNAFRSRLVLRVAEKDDEDNDDDAGSGNKVRELVVAKSNYGPEGEKVRVSFDAEKRIFVPVGSHSELKIAAHQAKVDEMFLHCLDRVTAHGRIVSPNTGKNYAPSIFEDMPEAKANGIKRNGFKAAMERLFTANRIRVIQVGPASKSRDKIVRVVMSND